MNITCPECEAQINNANPLLRGEIILCPDCGVEFEVINVNPLTLEIASTLGEGFGE